MTQYTRWDAVQIAASPTPELEARYASLEALYATIDADRTPWFAYEVEYEAAQIERALQSRHNLNGED